MGEDIIRFLWSRSYREQGEGRKRFFCMAERSGNGVTFELREKDNHKRVVGVIRVSEDGKREECILFWTHHTLIRLVADDFIPRGLKGRRMEDGRNEVLVGDEWVEYGKHHEAVRHMDEINR